MQLHKTSRARAELQRGVRTLGQRERTLLLLADGSRSARDFQALFDGDGEEIALRLLSEGYLERQPAPASARPVPAKAAPRQAARPADERAASARPFAPSETPSEAPPSSLGAQYAGADPFEGKRSLATTRMFLFDICERMFARRSPAMAQYFHEELRNAKDRPSMLATSRKMLEHIETVAGHERADALSERIAMLLPEDAWADMQG